MGYNYVFGMGIFLDESYNILISDIPDNNSPSAIPLDYYYSTILPFINSLPKK